MKLLAEVFWAPFVQQVGWVLLHSFWEGLLIGAGFGCLRFVLRRSSANLRYLAGCFALALLVAAPVVTLFLGAAPSLRTGPTDSGVVGFSLTSATFAGLAPHVPYEPGWTDGLLRRAASLCDQVAPYLAALWLPGVVFVSLRLFRSWWWSRQLRCQATNPVAEAWVQALDDLRVRLGVNRPVRLLQSALVQVPTVIGWLRPVILLPASTLTGLPPNQLEAILVHELAHVRRLDYFVNAAQCLIETLMFYHPIVWWISRTIREERENCCDDFVVRVCGDRLSYARALAALEETRADLPALAFAASGGGLLLNRIRRLFGMTTDDHPATARQVGGLALLGLGSLLVIIGLYLNLAPATYRATTRVKLEREWSGANDGRNPATYDPYFLQTEFEIIQSPAVLERVVRDLNLSEAWAAKAGADAKVQSTAAVALLRGYLSLRPIRGTTFVEIQVQQPSADLAAKIANTIASSYRDYRTELATARSRRGTKILQENLAEQNQKVNEARSEVEALRQKLDLSPATRINSALDGRGSSSRQLQNTCIDLKSESIGLETLLRQLRKLESQQLIQALPTAAADTLTSSFLEQQSQLERTLVAAKKDFGPAHPDVIKAEGQLKVLNGQLDVRARGVLEGLQARLVSLNDRLDYMNKELERARLEELEKEKFEQPYFEAQGRLQELERFAQVIKLKLESEAMDQAVDQTARVEILDQAVPPLRPYSPNRPRATVLMVLGLILDGAGLRLLRTRRGPIPAA